MLNNGAVKVGPDGRNDRAAKTRVAMQNIPEQPSLVRVTVPLTNYKRAALAGAFAVKSKVSGQLGKGFISRMLKYYYL